MYKRIQYIILLLVIPQFVSASVLDSLWHEYQKNQNADKKVEILVSIYQLNVDKNDIDAADSTIGFAIDILHLSAKDSQSVEVYKKYFAKDVNSDDEKSLEYANNFISIANRYHNDEWLYWANISLAKALIDNRKYEQAFDKINKASYYAELTGNDVFIADCLITTGKCLEGQNKKIDAFRNYLNALNHAQKSQNTESISTSYKTLSFFYLLIANYERAKEYKIKQLALHTNSPQVDSLKVIRLLSDLSIIYYYNKERGNAEKLTNKIVAYSRAHDEKEMFKTALVNHRTFLSENGLFKDLANFYTHEYPDELKKMAVKDTIGYNRIMGYICEEKNNIDSARYYFAKAEKMILSVREKLSKIYVSNFMKRYAQFLLRTGNNKLAIEKMQSSYQYAKEVDYLPYLIETSHYLDSLNYAAGNTKDAYTYTKLNKEYVDRQEASIKQDALLLMEIDNETKQQELIAKQEEAATEHRHNIQYTAITFSIISVFIIFIMMGVFKVSKGLIRSMGFFSFIFFFEFIVLLLDHKIMEITHHEPWKMLGIKIIIISMLLPFHHWIEHRVTHYLIEHHLVDKEWLNNRFWNRKKEAPPMDNELPNNSEL